MTNTTANKSSQKQPQISNGPFLQQLAGMSEARAWGESLVLALEDYKARKIPWSDVDPGCVLYGPPGTGKTTFAKALASTAKLPLITATVGEWQSAGDAHLGNLLQAMYQSFSEAAARAPCILFIDELDSIPKRGTDSRSATYWNQFTNAMLKALDDLAEVEGVVVLGACNHPELLDPALVRSGRMDRMIEISLPSVEEIETILQFHLTLNERLAVQGTIPPGHFRTIALLCAGMSGADIAKLVRQARNNARLKKRRVSVLDFTDVLDPVETRPDAAMQRRIAIHEVGHAVAGYRLALVQDITLSIVAARNALGAVRFANIRRPVTRKWVESRLIMLLAGRAAEQVFLTDVSAGAGGADNSDLAHATALAIEAVTRLGLSEHGTLLWHPNSAAASLSTYPAEVQKEADTMLRNAYTRAVKLIEDDWDFTNSVAMALVEKRVLSHKEFTRLDRRAAPPQRLHPLQVTWKINQPLAGRAPPRFPYKSLREQDRE